MSFTRRRFLTLSALSAAAAAVPGFAQENGSPDNKGPAGSPKKGLGLGVRNLVWPGMIATLRCRWSYNWTGVVPFDQPPGVAFVPMVRSRQANPEKVAAVAADARAHGITDLLGFNEPDAKKQDDMSVAQALEAWPLLMETGLRLGSPACIHADKEWMEQFMAGVEERKLRVDFVCVHSYGGPAPGSFLKRLERIQKLYDRPLWITEFGVGDWKAASVAENQHAPETVLRFMENVLPALERLDYVERYAWFPSEMDSAPLGTSALFDNNGTLTPLGECYRDA
jgi:hypothetical protein